MVEKRSVGEIIFDICNILFMILLAITMVYPFWNIAVKSISTNAAANSPGLHLWTNEPVFEAYRSILHNKYLGTAFRNTIFRTVVGTATNVLLSVIVAYPLSKKYLPLRTLWTTIIVFTMFFGGGLIPSYLINKNLGLVGSWLSWILPGAIGTYNMIIVRNYFQSLPPDLEESARIDGASEMRVLFQIVLPISVPIIATVALWYAVGHWNSWFDAMVYTSRENDLIVLQLLLRRMLIEGTDQHLTSGADGTTVQENGFVPTPDVLKCATIMVSSIPIICVYPFVQRYFMKGIMVGSLKG